MKKLWLRNALALLVVILVVGVAETAFAQYLLTKAGFVNRADGQVEYSEPQ
jgi:hypothetical protein